MIFSAEITPQEKTSILQWLKDALAAPTNLSRLVKLIEDMPNKNQEQLDAAIARLESKATAERAQVQGAFGSLKEEIAKLREQVGNNEPLDFSGVDRAESAIGGIFEPDESQAEGKHTATVGFIANGKEGMTFALGVTGAGEEVVNNLRTIFNAAKDGSAHEPIGVPVNTTLFVSVDGKPEGSLQLSDLGPLVLAQIAGGEAIVAIQRLQAVQLGLIPTA